MFLCVLVHKRKNDKKEVICRFSVFLRLFVPKTNKDKTEVDFCFPFLLFLVHKRKNDKKEVEFRFSFFVFLFSKKQKTIKRKANFVYLFLEKDSIKQ